MSSIFCVTGPAQWNIATRLSSVGLAAEWKLFGKGDTSLFLFFKKIFVKYFYRSIFGRLRNWDESFWRWKEKTSKLREWKKISSKKISSNRINELLLINLEILRKGFIAIPERSTCDKIRYPTSWISNAELCQQLFAEWVPEFFAGIQLCAWLIRTWQLRIHGRIKS